VVLFGAQGQLGSAILRFLHQRYPEKPVTTVSRGEDWKQVLEELPDFIMSDWVFASGVTDPKAPEDEIRRVNTETPISIIEAALSFTRLHSEAMGPRFLTLGSIQENFPELAGRNAYLKSKLDLSRWIEKKCKDPLHSKRFVHLRVHTIFSDEFKSHMFLGQIWEALKNESPFKMSHGMQLREYLHVDDFANAMMQLLAVEWTLGPVMELNHGDPLALRDLASKIFSRFKSEGLLEIGERPADERENIERKFERSPDWLLPHTRQAVPAIISILEKKIAKQKLRKAKA